jgi:hypothetical protein
MNRHPAREALINLWCPKNDSDDFIIKLRIYSVFDEGQYQALVLACRTWLATAARTDHSDKIIEEIFLVHVPLAANLMRHDNFISLSCPEGMDEEHHRGRMRQLANELDSIASAYCRQE